MKSLLSGASFCIILLAPASVLAQTYGAPGYTQQPSYTQQSTTFFSGGISPVILGGCSSSICGIANTILYTINYVLVPVLFAVAFLVFLYGIARAYIFSGGDPIKVKEGHHLLLWGLVAFAVMISIWGLVNIVANTFGLGGFYAPSLPLSY